MIATRKRPAQRAFTGMAGSPLAKVKSLLADGEQSYKTLRVPKTPDRQDPTPFDVWIDAFGQKHGAIDLDSRFQEYAFDPHLGHVASSGVDSERPESGDGEVDECSPMQDLGIAFDRSGRKGSIKTGLLDGDREIKRRRPNGKSWWVFDAKLIREFLRSKYDPSNTHEAEKAAFVLHSYYYQNREDEDIWEENSWFENIKKAKQYRQFIVRQGAERFQELKPESTWHGRKEIWRSPRCSDPDCAQCRGNEASNDFSGRIHVK